MTFRASVERYLGAVAQQYHRGDAREESYYDVLKQLWEELGSQLSSAHATLTVLPRQTEAGNPDMRVWSGQQHVTGYIEAKEPKETNLDRVEVSEQLKRYRAAFPNVILTNFLEFRLYRFGQPMGQPVTIGSLQALQAGMKVPLQHEDQFRELVERFFDFQLPRTYTAQTLAVALADRTRYLQQQVLAQLLDDEGHKLNSELVNLMAEFKQVLMSDLTSDTFADLYAQTITYGLFAARMRVTGTFTRETALNGIPATIGILRKLFKYISIGDTPERLRVIIDDIADVLAVADTDTVFSGYDKNGRDPVADFYETFLGEYDPAKKKQHGVYYTPQPVVSYIVRSVDQILRDSFGKPDGLADPSVTVLDPAAGTMTFPATAVRLAAATYKAKYGDGSLDSWIKGHVLRDFYAFELMMAPYAIGHLRMGILLTELGYTMSSDDRFKLYLTNTLEDTVVKPGQFKSMAGLAEESLAAGAVKRRQPVLAIMGNPPYSNFGQQNKGAWIRLLLEDYKKGLDEKKINLDDDFIKFIRFSQWKIDQAGEGVLGFITNNTYLDGVTHRVMRSSLAATFGDIYVLNLHGSVKRQEHAPDGGLDENVFDIQQGVCIALFVKRKGDLAGPRVHYADLWGTRESKYEWLGANTLGGTAWTDLVPAAPEFWFVPRGTEGAEEWQDMRRLDELFEIDSSGIQTKRDKVTIAWSEEQLRRVLTDFASADGPEGLRSKYGLPPDGRDWTIRWASEHARNVLAEHQPLTVLEYRPFDVRWTVLDRRSKGWVAYPRFEVMRHMISPNLGLVTTRQLSSATFQHAWITEHPIDGNTISLQTREYNYIFPLYLYPDTSGAVTGTTSELFENTQWPPGQGGRVPNLKSAVVEGLAKDLGLQFLPDGCGNPTDGTFGPEDLLAYIYAVLYSPTYRERYTDFLKSDFPRIPFTKDRDTFFKLAELGQQLIDLHLMRSPELDNPISRFCGKGDSAVTKVEYDADRGRVSINPTQYFDGITPDLWTYQIGGYQVLAKWLKDRKGRFLTSADTIHYSRVVTVLSKTTDLQCAIDSVVTSIFHEGDT
ncbi:DNA methyltransferase [Candidatus Cryosericum hinesii]|jgi:type I restriction-modification system DNA methylase subunit|uniref:site-specific DNA-methyltransferase (adenine-specific) n=2 Tax=Candidatus Cryosericum hinesii TaxID=2290915 RepID=A0A398DLY0_9BACT|nr:type ISP restriction/modification enzyme [Candidatus Cryosericum hinesii]RIE11851.1 DNA methyltransferase [Candidatus Cryosericum hinesii]RIE12012.1 DNA methyltransferase [Candidatus Cryosericum hinesii]